MTPNIILQSSSSFIPILAIGIPLVIVGIWWIGTYNGLVRLRNHCRESWADIDTELKRRHDLIPNLVNTVKGYAEHERSVLTEVIEARAKAAAPHSNNRDIGADEGLLMASLGKLFALAENYPDLKADRNFLDLQQELARTEDRLQTARRLYNANVRDMNNRVEMFPSSLIANMSNFTKWEYFEVEEAARATPVVEF